MWTGDNFSTYGEAKSVIHQLLSLSIAGLSFTGADIPGFFGSPVPEDLVMDFYRLGGWFPFMRAHSHIETAERDPWLFSERVKSVIKDTIFLRYSLIHYL
jgi:mannosyl-oligosaccharide alpha-1,3-glucosidase